MIYIVEFLKNRATGEWAKSTNSASSGQYPTAEEAARALEKNPHSKGKIFEFRIRGEEVMASWVLRSELVCAKCGKAGSLEIWQPWDASTPHNYNSHNCSHGQGGCGQSWRDEGAMRALCGIGTTGTTTVQVYGNTNSTGKEDKMFQVTTYNFATGIVANTAYDRLCAAKDALERAVAGFRSANAAQAKTFFTASILDTKTGKFHGFVSDPPPAIELEGGE